MIRNSLAAVLLAASALVPAAAVTQDLPLPRVQTAPANDNSNRAASTSYVDRALVDWLRSGGSGNVSGMTVLGRSLQDRAQIELFVMDAPGVKCDGVNDDGPGLRLMAQTISNKRVKFPPGRTCRINTFVDPGYPGDPAALLITGATDFSVEATGTTFAFGNHTLPTAGIFIDRSKRWSWRGGRIVGNRVGLAATAENAAFALTSAVDFHVSDVSLTGYGGNGAGFVGGWNVNGRIARILMDGVGLGFDFAWPKNLIVEDSTIIGADTNGNRGAGQIGAKCFSVVEDRLISGGFNYTGVTYDDADNVSFLNNECSNVSTGFYAASGSGYRISGNKFHNLPGLNSAKGIGIYLDYINGGTYSSVGYPVKNVRIEENHFENIGSAVPGFSVLLAGAAITNADKIDGIVIGSNVFDAKNSHTAIFSDTATGVANLVVAPSNMFKGATTTPLGLKPH